MTGLHELEKQMTSWEFPASGPVDARVSLPSGSVRVTASHATTATISLVPARSVDGSRAAEQLIGETEVSFEGGRLTVKVPKQVHIRGNAALDLTIELPAGSSLDSRTASADLKVSGELGTLTVDSASGDVTADTISGQANITTASGDVRLQEVTGDARIKTASGDTVIGRAHGELTVNSASGDLQVGQAKQWVQAKTASGDIEIGSIAEGRADVTTVSGDVTIAVPPGIGVYLDLSSLTGKVRSDLAESGRGDAEGETGLALTCNSISGDIRVTRANVGVTR
jgi:Putative adhesin